MTVSQKTNEERDHDEEAECIGTKIWLIDDFLPKYECNTEG